jgi:hypothetical protein
MVQPCCTVLRTRALWHKFVLLPLRHQARHILRGSHGSRRPKDYRGDHCLPRCLRTSEPVTRLPEFLCPVPATLHRRDQRPAANPGLRLAKLVGGPALRLARPSKCHGRLPNRPGLGRGDGSSDYGRRWWCLSGRGDNDRADWWRCGSGPWFRPTRRLTFKKPAQLLLPTGANGAWRRFPGRQVPSLTRELVSWFGFIRPKLGFLRLRPAFKPVGDGRQQDQHQDDEKCFHRRVKSHDVAIHSGIHSPPARLMPFPMRLSFLMACRPHRSTGRFHQCYRASRCPRQCSSYENNP